MVVSGFVRNRADGENAGVKKPGSGGGGRGSGKRELGRRKESAGGKAPGKLTERSEEREN